MHAKDPAEAYGIGKIATLLEYVNLISFGDICAKIYLQTLLLDLSYR